MSAASARKLNHQREEHLSDAVENALHNYFEHLNGHDSHGLYDMVIGEVEKPLLVCALEHFGNNQTKTAELLGISRVTLRKKLKKYQLI
jgi:Factor for inversion stimulation Fis, transcriptional activator